MAGAIRGITVEIGGDTTKLGKALADVNTKTKNLQSELKGVNSLLKMDPSNVTLLKQKQDILTASIENTKEKLDKLKEAQSQVQDQFDKGKITAEQFRDFQREIVNTEKKLESLKDEMKDFGSVTAQQIAIAGDKVKEFGSTVEGAGEKLLPATAGIIGAGTACVSTADDLKTATNDFLTSTGTARESVKTLSDGTVEVIDNTEKFKEVIEGIYSNNYGESFEDIADAMAKVKANISDIDDSELQKVTESALALRDTFDYDVAESTRSVNTLMDQFGITADEAFNLLTQGAQNGLDFSGELLDSVNEYSVQFEKFGFSAEDMFSIFANGAENGAFNLDKVGDAVKELSVRVVDGSDTTTEGFELLGLNADEMADKFAQGGDSAKEAFNQVIAGLADMEDPIDQNTAGVNLFGTMWEDLGPQVVTSLSTVSDSISSTNDAMEALKQQKYDDLKNQISQLGRTFVSDVAVPLGEQLLPIVSNIISKVSEWISKFGELSPVAQKIILVVGAILASAGPLLIFIGKIISAFGTIMTVVPKVVSFVKGIGTAFKALGAVLSANPLGIVIIAITALVAGLIYAYNHSEKFRDIVNNAFAKVKEVVGAVIDGLVIFFTQTIPNAITSLVTWFQSLPEKITTAISSLPTGFQLVFHNIKNIVLNVVNIFKNQFEIIKTVVQTVISVVKAIFSGDFASIPGIVSGAMEKIKGFISSIFDSIITIAINWIASFINFFRGLFASLVTIFTNIGTNLSTWWTNLKTTFVTKVKEIITAVVTFFTELPGKIVTAISTAITNIATWGSEMLTTAKTKMSEVVTGIVDTFTDLPGKMVDIGKNIISGIISGIGSMVSNLYDSIKGALSGLVSKAKDALGIHSPSRVFANVVGKQIPAGIATGIEANSDMADKAVEDMTDDLTNQAVNLNGATINRKLATTFTMGSANLATENTALLSKLDSIYERLNRLQIVLDTGTLVGEAIDKIDAGLANKQLLTARGV